MQKRRLNEPKLFIGKAPRSPEIQRSGSSKGEPAPAKGRNARNLAISANSQSRHHNLEIRPGIETTIRFIVQQAKIGQRFSCSKGDGAGVDASLNGLEATSSTDQEGQQFHARVMVTSER